MPVSTSFSWGGSRLAEQIRAAAFEALREGAEAIFEQSQQEVPLDQGPLQESGQVVPDEAAGEVVIAYGTTPETAEYAVPQHERLDYEHTGGRKARYLADPVQEQTQQVLESIADAVREQLK